MGVRTLADLRNDVQQAIGDVGWDDERFDRCINDAVLELAGGIDFETLEDFSTTPTVNGTASYAIPTGAQIIRAIRDTTNAKLLGYINRLEYMRRPITPTGLPKKWTRIGDLIYIWPTPSGAYSLSILSKSSPAVMSTDAATTEFPAIWDPVVYFLATSNAWLYLGNEQKAIAWLSRSISFLQSRLTEQDLFRDSAGLGKSMPQGVEMLQNRLSALQGAAGG